MPAPKNQMTDEERSRRFIEKARELGADTPEGRQAFDRTFKKIVKPKEQAPA